MTANFRSSRTLPASPAELRAAALVVARDEGWTVRSPDTDPPPREGSPPEARVVVTGAGLPGRCLLRVRERRDSVADRDLEARRAAACEHVLGVLEQLEGRTVRGREVEAVVLHHGSAGPLDGVLARRTGLRSGEAATLILGVAAGVGALHRNGWASPDLSDAAVVLGRDGCPALDGLDRLRPLDPASAVADAEAFHAWSRRICLRVADGEGMRLLSAVEAGLRRGHWPAVENAVLAVAPPEPVGPLDTSEPGGFASETASRAGEAHTRRLPRTRRGVVSVTMAALDGEPGRAVTRRLGAWARRRPALVALALAPPAIALVVVALVPSSPAGRPSAVVPSSSSPSSASRSAVPAPGQRTEPAPIAATEPVGAAAPAQAGSGVDAEDPVLAAPAILRARHSCFVTRAAADDCLTAVIETGSALLQQESADVGAGGAAARRDYTGAQVSLVERWGDAALVGVAPDRTRTPQSEPASLLLVRGEAGWRLRAVFP